MYLQFIIDSFKFATFYEFKWFYNPVNDMCLNIGWNLDPLRWTLNYGLKITGCYKQMIETGYLMDRFNDSLNETYEFYPFDKCEESSEEEITIIEFKPTTYIQDTNSLFRIGGSTQKDNYLLGWDGHDEYDKEVDLTQHLTMSYGCYHIPDSITKFIFFDSFDEEIAKSQESISGD